MQQNKPADFFLPSDLVARALQSLIEQAHDEIDRLSRQAEQGDPDVKSETKYRLRDYRALIKAAFEWGRGVRPVAIAGGWLVPSRTTAGEVYEVTRPNGYWQCSPNCKAVGAHWHTMLALGIQHAIELADSEDAGDEPTTTTTGPDAPIAFSDGVPIPAEPDPARDEVDDEPWCPGVVLARSAVRVLRRAA